MGHSTLFPLSRRKILTVLACLIPAPSAFLVCGSLSFQWVEASDLEEENKLTNPVKYHEAWRKLCAVQYVSSRCLPT
jgi:hypothetical protein